MLFHVEEVPQNGRGGGEAGGGGAGQILRGTHTFCHLG